jgi:hypothetical protein
MNAHALWAIPTSYRSVHLDCCARYFNVVYRRCNGQTATGIVNIPNRSVCADVNSVSITCSKLGCDMTNMRKLAQECLGLNDVIALAAKPLNDGSGWYVEVSWSNGRVEHVGTFGSDTTARDWIEWDAPKFLRGGPAF